MNTTPDSMKPRPVVGIDIRTLPIGPEEAFVLSRVDGCSTAREIGYSTSLSEEQVVTHLHRLRSLGAVDFDAPLESIESRHISTPETIQVRLESAIGRDLGASTGMGPDVQVLYDEAELNATADLDMDRRREILDLYHRLETLDHYQLLGIAPDADRRAIKAAYYEKVKVFHPDRYFGKDLGAFRNKLDQCFARLTEAHDALATATTRAEYDAYLLEQRQAADLERAIAHVVTFSDLDELERQLADAVNVEITSAPNGASALQSDTPLTRATSNSPSPQDVTTTHSTPAPRMSDDERKRFLARKLRVSSASLRAPARPSTPSPPSAQPPPSREQIATQLRRQLGATRREEQLRKLEGHMAAADAALAANDPVAAANALRHAQSLAPTDVDIAERLSASQALAATALSDTYLRQAEYEEKSGRYETAARSYERAARGKPSAELWEAAARCLLEAQGDLRTAGDFARLSISLDSERAASHLLLGRIFLAARMRSSAIAELERARRLDPNNDTVLSLLKRIANDEI